MKTYILYTTSKSKLVQKQANIFAYEISQTKGRGEVKVKVVYKRLFKKPDVGLRADGYIMPSWEWFNKQLPKQDYDGIIFHFSTKERTRWGIKSPTGSTIGGSRNSNNKDFPQFWVCDDLLPVPAKGYEEARIYNTDIIVTDFLRKLFHEHGHYDEDVDDTVGDKMTQLSVHEMDYEHKRIHLYHYLIDFRGKKFKEDVARVVSVVVKLTKKFI